MPSTEHLSDLQRSFMPPAPLTGSRPRDVRLTAAGRALFALAVLLVICALIAFVLLTEESQRQAANRRAIVASGVMTSGEVAHLWTDGDNLRKVAYRFDAEGQSFTGDVNVSRERRSMLAVGAPIEVRFLPGNPRINDLGGTPRSGLPAVVAPIVALLMMSGGALCLWAIRRQRRLLEDGRVAPALVTAHKDEKSSHGHQHSMTFAFPLLSGAVASGKTGTTKKRPAVGSVITVVYDPDQPTRSRVYPFSLVRPV